MRTIEINVYEYEELNEKAKDKVRSNLSMDYCWGHDVLNSLRAFADEIGIDIIDYEIDWGCSARSFVKWRKNYNYNTRFIKNDLTGYCFDYDLTNTWNKTRDVDECIEELLFAVEKDYEYQQTDEYLIDMCNANEYTFDEYGNFI
tara:strand:- start:122 stop:556 length:435 start_codon:yes stop_codon:yes gene_type:complete